MINMPEVQIHNKESFEAALRKFKRDTDKEGILRELRERKHYQKPSEKKRKRFSRGSR
jgi:small subunit ribosomal protein S21